MVENLLYYGDNLDVLRCYFKQNESVDLIYLDPPFNSNRDYNAFFRERDDSRSAAMIPVFADTWTWCRESAATFDAIIQSGPQRVAQAMRAFQQLMPKSDMLAYLTMMAPRLVELYRVLKPTGSLYLHCDPTASHHLKTLLDATFGPRRFLNEIVWKRSSAHSDTKQGMRRCGKIHDTLLLYTKSEQYTWNPVYTPYSQEYLESEYKRVDQDGRRFAASNPSAAKPGGDTQYLWRVKRKKEPESSWEADLDDEYINLKDDYEYKGVPPYKGRFWAYSKEKMVQFAKSGLIHHGNTGAPRIRQYADQMPGIALQDIWDDIPPELGKRNLGYPTQKPQALLERIITVSSNPGDVVLDPFCGCGTAVDAAHGLGRDWVGIDVTHLATSLIKYRLGKVYGAKPGVDYEVRGEPRDWESAKALAEEDRFKFQAWAVGLLTARPTEEARKGKDQGIDGRYFFQDEGESGPVKEVIISVKSGKPKVSDLRDLNGVIAREGAAIGVLVTLNPPTEDMVKEVAGDFYVPPWGGSKKFAKLQIITIQELLEGAQIHCPSWSENRTFKVIPKTKKKRERPDMCLLPFQSPED